MKKTSPEAVAANQEELLDWQKELARLQKLLPVQASRDQLKADELPALDMQISDLEARIPELSGDAEEVRHGWMLSVTSVTVNSIRCKRS
jgi:DNA repair protein RAD50